ncbi:apolipoprotein A-II [Stigmatopora nigra]
MNTKYVIALLLTLQVSMSLCDVPAPEQELVDKYNDLKATFYKRLINAFGKIMDKVEEGKQSQATKDFIASFQNKPQLDAIRKVSSGIVQEIAPIVDKTREGALGLYGHYLRPHIGQYLSDSIDEIKKFLDIFMPAQ